MKFEFQRVVPESARHDEPISLRGVLVVDEAIVMEPNVELILVDPETNDLLHSCRLRDSMPVSWLPRGRYELTWHTARFNTAGLRQCIARIRVINSGSEGIREHSTEDFVLMIVPEEAASKGMMCSQMSLQAAPDSRSLQELSWNKGHENWFSRHFDHAATTIISYMLGDHPLLRGRILDVGCGDGIISLGVALRCEPELMVGLDPFHLFEQLPRMMSDAGIPADAIPPNLRFDAADANHLPYEDDSFDVVISWGSLEHIAGGYLQALREIKRVLRPGGLFFVTPGLYYARQGSHLAEFCSEPYFHLTRTREEIGQIVRETPPDLMDRSGHIADAEQYLRWYDELNPITASGFENDLREHDFEPWRVAVRCEDRVDLTPALAKYPILDLAINDLYVSCWNRKPVRPAGYRQRRPELPE